MSCSGCDRIGHAAARLTPRQREIAALIARGYDNRRIADELESTPGTVSTHLQSIRARLRVRDREDIAAWARRHGLDGPRSRR